MNDEQIFALIAEQQVKVDAGDYTPLPDEKSQRLRELYAKIIELPLTGSDHKIFNGCGTCISDGYTRIVIGDFGAYFEFSTAQINHAVIEPRWLGKPKRPVKYLWMVTKDREKTKIYSQQRRVAYADYMPGMYYMSYFDAV